MGERASSRSDIAALKPRFRQISYASGVFFTLAMHRRLLTNFFLGRFHLGLGPSLHRLSPQQPHFLDNPLFDRVGNSLPPSLLMRIAREDQGAPQELPKTPRRSVSPPPYAKPPSILESRA
jgi:hypothetical protein